MKIHSLIDLIRRPEIYKFLIVSATSALIVQTVTIIFTSVFGIFYAFSVAIGFEFGIIWAFFLHDKWTFAHIPKTSRRIVRFIKLHVFALITLGLNEVILIFLTEKIGIKYYESEAIAIIITFFFNFFFSKKITFKN